MIYIIRYTISIHALREESDFNFFQFFVPIKGFQSTLSVRRATATSVDDYTAISISIHALREESDGQVCYFVRCADNFNPRSP